MTDKTYARILNNFLHDMATGTWAACLLVLVVLETQRAGVPADAARVLAGAASDVFVLLLAALAIIAVTGGLRLRYWRNMTPAAEHPQKRNALLAKHAAFVVVYGGGTAWAWTLAR